MPGIRASGTPCLFIPLFGLNALPANFAGYVATSSRIYTMGVPTFIAVTSARSATVSTLILAAPVPPHALHITLLRPEGSRPASLRHSSQLHLPVPLQCAQVILYLPYWRPLPPHALQITLFLPDGSNPAFSRHSSQLQRPVPPQWAHSRQLPSRRPPQSELQ